MSKPTPKTIAEKLDYFTPPQEDWKTITDKYHKRKRREEMEAIKRATLTARYRALQQVAAKLKLILAIEYTEAGIVFTLTPPKRKPPYKYPPTTTQPHQ